MNKFLKIFKIKDLRNKILIVAGLLIVYRALAVIPIPGIDFLRLREFLDSSQLFGFLNLFSGGALSNLSIMMLGVSPYITATIIMQLLTMVFPKLKVIYYEEGSVGRAKFNRLCRNITVPLAIFSGYGFLNMLASQGILPNLGMFDIIKNVVAITVGAMIAMWIGELITEQKIGNGISLIIFAGIVSAIPSAIKNAILTYSPEMLPVYLVFLIVSLAVIAGVVFVNEGERKVPIVYAKRVRGSKMYGGSSSYLPLKVNQAGVIPIIFAVSILLFPQFFAQAAAIFSKDLSVNLTKFVSSFFNNHYIYSSIYFVLVVAFTYLYTSITFDPKEISKNLQRAGGFITGIRPGEATSDFLAKIIRRITLFGALFLGVIAILPNIAQIIFSGASFLTIGGTSLLIVVSVALETSKQINSQIIMREYDSA